MLEHFSDGLSAKPIIDIDVVIKDYSMLDAVISALERIDYHHEGNLGIAGRKHLNMKAKPICGSIIYMYAREILRN